MIIEKPGTIFMQPWWLDAVAPGQWSEVSISNNDEIIARMPYCIVKKMGLKFITMPALTQHLGPWIQKSESEKSYTQLSSEYQLANELISQLPQFHYFTQRFSTHFTNWLPFYWQGFQQTTYYSYSLDDITDPQIVWKNLHETARRQVRKAEKQLEVQDCDVESFYNINTMTFTRQGLKNPHSFQKIENLYNACTNRDACKIFKAIDESNRIHAVLFLVWDDERAYYLMGGADPELRKSGASSLLMWHAIQFASTKVSIFDFEGSMISGIEKFFRTFGATPKPYFKITKVNHPLLRIAKNLIAK